MLLTCMASMAAQADSQIYAWLENDAQKVLIHVVRSHEVQAYDPGTGFQACDEVVLEPAVGDSVAIITADGSRLLLDPAGPSIRLSCGTSKGVGHDVVAFLKALLQKSNMRLPTIAATRSFDASTSCMKGRLGMALLSHGSDTPTMLTSNTRSLLLAWTGAAGPFTLEIESARGSPVLHAIAINENTYRAYIRSLPPGRYRLHLSDSCHSGVEEKDLEVVPPAQLPAVPAQIASLPEPGRTIFYADYLVGLGDGRWGLEALQLVGTLPVSDPSARAWIRQWTGSD
jgi:hypothetical protein